MDGHELGALIRKRRDRLGLSTSRLAELVGRAPATVRSWERGKATPTDPEVLSSLAAVLGVDETDVFAIAGVEKPARQEAPTLEQSLASIAPARQVEERGPANPSREEPLAGATADETPLLEKVGGALERLRDSLRERSEARTPAAGDGTVQPAEQPARLMVPYSAPPTSYLEDTDERLTYRIRSLLTALAVLLTFLVLFWSAGRTLEALGETWDALIGGL